MSSNINKRIVTKKKNGTYSYNMVDEEIENVSDITTLIPPSGGGTGISSYTAGDLIVATGATTLSKFSAVVAGYVLISNGVNTPPIYGKVDLTLHVQDVLLPTNGGTGIAIYSIGDLIYATNSTTLGRLIDVNVNNVLLSGGVGALPYYGKVDLTNTVTGTLPVANGGLNITSYTIGDILYASGISTFSKLADIATGNVLISGGVGVAPSYGKVGMTTHITGVLNAINGGTGLPSYTIGDILCASGINSISVINDVATGNVLLSGGVGVLPYYGKVNLNNMVTGTLAIANGGLNITSYTAGDLIYASGATTLSKLSDIATGNVLISGGIGVAPSYGKVGLTTHISGTLGVTNGGTNMTGYTIGDILIASATNILSVVADIATNNVLLSAGINNPPTYGKVNLSSMVTNILPVGNGGSGLSGFTAGSLIYATGATTLSVLNDVATGNVLLSGGIGVAPSYGKVNLTTAITGTLGIANGGLNLTGYTTGDLIYASGASTLAKLSDVAVGNVLISGGVGVAPSYGKVGLTTHVTGILQIANGGTNASSLAQGTLYSTGTNIASASIGTQYNILQYASNALSFVPSQRLVQYASTSSTAYLSITTLFTEDNTTPQITGGSQVLSITYTALATTNNLYIYVSGNGRATNNRCIMALFMNGGANAVATSYLYTANKNGSGTLLYTTTAGVTTPQAIALRAGIFTSGTLYFNGGATGRRFGGVDSVTLQIFEYASN
jgi:hypothetical protein